MPKFSHVVRRYDAQTLDTLRARFLDLAKEQKPSIITELSELLPEYRKLISAGSIYPEGRFRLKPLGAKETLASDMDYVDDPIARQVLECVKRWAQSYFLVLNDSPAPWAVTTALNTLGSWAQNVGDAAARRWFHVFEGAAVPPAPEFKIRRGEFEPRTDFERRINRESKAFDSSHAIPANRLPVNWQIEVVESDLVVDEIIQARLATVGHRVEVGAKLKISQQRTPTLDTYLGWLVRRQILGDSIRDIATAPVRGSNATRAFTLVRMKTNALANFIGITPRKAQAGQPKMK